MDLNKLNEKFYLKTQEYFNTSRQFYWEGWKKLLPYLPRRQAGLQGENLQVLDLGCGNGRFGKFLAEHKNIDYIGIDNNQYLLDQAKKSLPQAKLIKQDLLLPWPVKEKFDLVAILGVMHHLSELDRAPLLRRAAACLKSNGVLFLSFWQFNPAKGKSIGNHDYLLPWHLGVDAERYCHLYSQEEINKLIKPLKLKLLDNFIADKNNRYLVLKNC
ncbi:MAG: class I SAM-dependent methyltransferase [Candidatus Beckwithbacteria bacterium]|nr:class I SAM-dependent methyltransferase [Candidatus Beckwithbacteria bacterium]